jgi:predicted amidohydrolase YtcJ
MRTVIQVCTFALLALAAPAQSQGWTPHADTIVSGGQIVTMNQQAPFAQALAIKDGKIIAVGDSAAVNAVRGPATVMVDAAGKTVIPGLQDSHIHFVSLGRGVRTQVDFLFARNAQDIVKSIADLKARMNAKPGDWLVGVRWDASRLPKMFTRWQLDAVSPENPVLLSRYRGVAVNTAAFKLMKIDDNDPATWPAWWLENPADFTTEDTILRERRKLTINGKTQTLNVPTGVFIGNEATKLVTVSPREEDFEGDVESVRLGVQELLKVGITSIVDPASNMGYNMRVYQAAYNRGYLDLKIASVYEGIFTKQSAEDMRKHFAQIEVNNLGDPYLRWRGVKIYGDGGPSARGSWLSKSYLHGHDEAEEFGVPVLSDYAAREGQFRAALDYGWELHTHSTGDAAMLQTSRLYDKLINEIHAKEPDKDIRWSIIHANMPLENPQVMDIMARHNVSAVIQPVMVWHLGNAWEANLGPERMARSIPVASYLRRGVNVASGSDYGISPYDPWLGVYAMLTRQDQMTGKVYGAQEIVGVLDALRTYTINGAYLTYEDKTKGSLEVGKAADLAVLDLDDIMDLQKNPKLCFDMHDRVLMTLVDGKVRYRKGTAEGAAQTSAVARAR